MLKYIGSKKRLLNEIRGICLSNNVKSVFDGFSGSSRVGYDLRKAGIRVASCDYLLFAYYVAVTYIIASHSQHNKLSTEIIDHLNSIKPEEGYLTSKYGDKFFSRANAAKMDAIRDEITRLNLEVPYHAIAITALLEAADKVDSTISTQMAYVKKPPNRFYNDVLLVVPKLIDGPPGEAHNADVSYLSELSNIDLCYYNPPYNAHSYAGLYHIWESIARWNKEDTYGIANKPLSCKTIKSNFNSKKLYLDEFAKLIDIKHSPLKLISLNEKAYATIDQILAKVTNYKLENHVSVNISNYIGYKTGVCSPDGMFRNAPISGHKMSTENLYLLKMVSI